MTDYTWTIGDGDEMRIRDTGTTVEFWFHTDSSTFNHDQGYSYTANGSTVSGEYDLVADGAWHRFASVNVTTDQTVSFTVNGAGIGWPTTTHSVAIERATVPAAPTINSLTPVSGSAIDIVFTSNGNGGSPVLEWQVGYGTNATTAQNFIEGDGNNRISGLTASTLYYFWARGRNAKGWGPWSARKSASTFGVPPAPDAVVLTNLAQKSLHAEFVGNGNGGSSILEWQIGYGKTSSLPPGNTIEGFDVDITGLDPGQTYYFWARGRNSVGWGPYSPRSMTTLIAGAMVNVGGVWKRALPYVKVAGVWKLARPWVKSVGVWKETST